MPIPPQGWGAVEILIWDYKETLEKNGHEILIVNEKRRDDIVRLTDSFNPDFIHIQYDEFYDLENEFKCKNVAITSHFGYLEQPNRYEGYWNIFHGFLGMKVARIFALSPSIAKVYTSGGFSADRVFVTPNGVRDELFSFNTECAFPNRSIYLAKVDYRKRQYLFQGIPFLDFAGNLVDPRYNKHNYLGEWNKTVLHEQLTNYANLVLLSDGEAHPLVCMEAMAAGLGLVISEYATANLDLSLPFIDIIPEIKINDLEYVSKVIADNQKKSVSMRPDIRSYAKESFSWDKVIKKYLQIIDLLE